MSTVAAAPATSCAADQPVQRVGGEQRGVAGDHDDGARRRGGQRLEGDPDRVPGAVLLLLDDRLAPAGPSSARCSVDRLAPVADHDDEVLGAERPGRGEDVPEQGAAADRVQDLRGGRAHPGALACGEDDHGGHRSGCGSAVTRLLGRTRRALGRLVRRSACRGYPPGRAPRWRRSGRLGSRAGTRTPIHGSKGRCPALRRPGIAAHRLLPAPRAALGRAGWTPRLRCRTLRLRRLRRRSQNRAADHPTTPLGAAR